MITMSKGLCPLVLAQKWAYDLGTCPCMSIKVSRKLHDMRIWGRIVRARKRGAIRVSRSEQAAAKQDEKRDSADSRVPPRAFVSDLKESNKKQGRTP